MKVLLLVVAAAALAGVLGGQVHADIRERTVSVTGSASETLEPDTLRVEIGVETQAGTASDALAENSALMAGVFEALRVAGLPDDDVSTSQLQIYPAYDYGQDRPVLLGYRAVNSVSVSTQMLGSAAAIIDGAVGAGANRVDSVSFGLSPGREAEARDRLVESAILDARARADLALEPLGYAVIGVKSVDLDERAWGGPAWDGPALAMADSYRSAPIAPGGAEVSVRAHVVFLMARA